MEISYFGHSCFKIKTKTTTVVTDPYDPEMVGLKYPKIEADIVTVSHGHTDHNFLEKIAGTPFVVNGPGEYEVKSVSIFGIESYHDNKKGKERGLNTVYLIEAEGLRVCHLGDLGQKLDEEQLEEVDGIDILLAPVGGFYTLGPKEAVEVIGQVEPLIVIPMHYKAVGMTSSFKDLVKVDDFTKELGIEVEPVKKLFISKDKLPEEREVVVLERRS